MKNGGRGVEMREMQQVRVVTNWEFTGVGREAERAAWRSISCGSSLQCLTTCPPSRLPRNQGLSSDCETLTGPSSDTMMSKLPCTNGSSSVDLPSEQVCCLGKSTRGAEEYAGAVRGRQY